MRKWVVLAGLALLTACASSQGKFDVVTLSNTLRLQEEHELLPSEIGRFPGDSMAPYLPKLVALVEKRDIRVMLISDLAGIMREIGFAVPADSMLWGYNTSKGAIFLDSSLGIDELFSTLLHEYGHSLQPAELNGTPEAQVFSEAISVVVCRRLGLDAGNSSFPYIHQFTKRFDVMRKYEKQINRHAEAILKELK